MEDFASQFKITVHRNFPEKFSLSISVSFFALEESGIWKGKFDKEKELRDEALTIAQGVRM
jgi:hypothetical protein